MVFTTELNNTSTKTRRSSVSETGHAKNVSNFETLVSYCSGYGEEYQPSKTNIKTAQLENVLADANTALHLIKIAKTTLNTATNTREATFAPLKKLATKIVSSLVATDAMTQTVEDAKTINRKIQGKRASNTPTEDPEAKRTISVSQQSFDAQLDNFDKLIELVSAEPLYAPNETDLKALALKNLRAEMRTANSNAINANTAHSNARISRNNVLYGAGTGLTDTASDVKAYVKSVFGPTSPQYKQLSGLKFRVSK